MSVEGLPEGSIYGWFKYAHAESGGCDVIGLDVINFLVGRGIMRTPVRPEI
jgi:hypothetical protein